MAYKSKLDWTNINRGQMAEDTQSALDLFIEAKTELEAKLSRDAIAAGAASEGDTFAFAYRSLPDVGMAITKRKAQASGFAGLKKPTVSLAEYREQATAQGRSI